MVMNYTWICVQIQISISWTWLCLHKEFIQAFIQSLKCIMINTSYWRPTMFVDLAHFRIIWLKFYCCRNFIGEGVGVLNSKHLPSEIRDLGFQTLRQQITCETRLAFYQGFLMIIVVFFVARPSARSLCLTTGMVKGCFWRQFWLGPLDFTSQKFFAQPLLPSLVYNILRQPSMPLECSWFEVKSELTSVLKILSRSSSASLLSFCLLWCLRRKPL